MDHKGLLLKPDDDDGEEYFWLNLANGELEPLPELSAGLRLRALETISLCNLNRGPLCRQRFLLVQAVERWALRAARGVDSATEQELEIWLAPDTPYKLAIRFRLTHADLGALAVEDRNRFKEASQSPGWQIPAPS